MTRTLAKKRLSSPCDRLVFGSAWWSVVVLLSTAPLGGGEWTGRVLEYPPSSEVRTPPVVSAVAIHPQGTRVAVAGDDHMLSVLDLQNGQRVQSLRGHSDWVRAVAYSPTGDLLASAGHDGRIVLWESRTGTALGEVSLPFAISALAFDQEASRLFVVGFGDRLQILDVSPRQWLSPWKCPSSDMRALACCAERGVVAAGGRNGLVRVWNTDGRVLQEYAAHRQRVWGLTFSADGRYLVSCGEDGTVRVSRLGAQEDFVLEIPGSKVMSVVFCGPDELATGGSDNRIHIWNLPRRQETAVLSGHTGSIAALASRGEILVSAGFDTTVRVWTRSGKLADR